MHIIFSFVAFFASFCTTIAAFYGNQLEDNIAIILFILCLFWLFFYGLKKIHKDELELKDLLFLNFSLYLGFILPNLIDDSFSALFWVSDSISTHVPESKKVMLFFQNRISFEEICKKQGAFTHFVTGFFFFLFGANSFSSLIGLLLLKSIAILATFGLGKYIFNYKVGLLATLTYILSPTTLFYNISLYKESAVQMLVVLQLLFTYLIFYKKKCFYIFPIIVILFLLKEERVYMTYLSFGSILAVIISLIDLKNKKWIWPTIIFLLSLILFFWVVQRLGLSYNKILWIIKQQRKAYSSFEDVLNEYNYNIPYLIAFIKTIFSPYFTFNKFDLFSNLSTLLIWGAFVNQIIILIAIIGFLKIFRKEKIHFALWFSFIIFLLITAHIAPWSGRLRDSFYPLISIYFAQRIYTAYFQNQNVDSTQNPLVSKNGFLNRIFLK